MDPNASPWAYAYNRIVPSTSGTSDDFQHQHLASISAAAGTSAQSLLLQAAHSSIAGFNATSGNFVPPGPIGGYNPVFQQIYHHAAQAAVQPKPAHYASSAVSTSHRQMGTTGALEKPENCRPQSNSISYSLNHAINLPSSSYYGDNSSSSGASPSPTTSATASTTLSWNTPVVGTNQQMSANAFMAMHQQQQDINQVEKVTNSKQANLHSKAQSKSYGDLIYVGSHDHQHEQVALQQDNNTIQTVSEENGTRPEEGFYTFVDGKLTYNIPAAAISSASLSNKLLSSSVKVVTPRKQSSGDCHQSAQQQNLSQIPSPAYPIYESPSLCSSVGSPPPAVKSLQINDVVNNSGHIIIYKSNTPTQQAQTSHVSTVSRSTNSNINRNNDFLANGVNNPVSPTADVGYSSVITSALQVHQQQQLQQQHEHLQHTDCWMGNSSEKVLESSKNNQKIYSVQSPPIQENNVYILPSSLQTKQTLIESVQQNADSLQGQSPLQQQMENNALHIVSSHAALEKQQLSHQQGHPIQSQHNIQSKQLSAEHVFTANSSLASQIQSTTKVEEVQKPIAPKKTPRKRQPKKSLLTNNEYSRTSQQNDTQAQSQVLREQQPIQHHQVQQQQAVQIQQQNGSFYDYSNRWVPQKHEGNADTVVFGNNNQQQQQTNPIQPQPAHVQSSQSHPHISQISQYYPAFPQHVSTQYAACMSQNTNLYNLTPLGQEAAQEHQNQQDDQNSHTPIHHNTNCAETQNQETAETTYKVIVPNIEDELHFLSNTDPKSSNASSQTQNNECYVRNVINQHKSGISQNQLKTDNSNSFSAFEKKCSAGKKTGFMDSYLKFLQGERDESPPPMNKSSRKFNYQKPVVQTDCTNSNKRKSTDINQPTTLPNVDNKNCSPVVETSSEPNSNECINIRDDGHKIKIISQTQILPKKRPHAQNIGTIQQNQVISQQNQSTELNSHTQFRQQHHFHQDPLALPPRRELSLRKAKSRSINEIMQTTSVTTDREEPEEFADSDADPVWTPQDEDSEDYRSGKFNGKRKVRRSKTVMATNKKDISTENPIAKTILPAIKQSKTITEVTNTSGNIASTDNFKTGDFIVLRSDLVSDWPIIWQVDSKCILQKYEPFCQNGKMFYRNMSKYASWNLDTKKLYLKAPVRIQIQSHTETIVEFMRSELLADDTEQFIEKIMDDYLSYRDHFEIYIQTMISQVLDPSFLSEINREKDEYFLSSVRTIDEIMENCKRKLLSITPWTRSVIVSIETWPQCHVFTEWGQNNVNQKNCGGCHQPGISVRFLLFGHPYNTTTMQTIPVDIRVGYEKDILLCRICAARADIFHKIAHEKYNLFGTCTRRVEEHQKEYPGKTSTEILNDLLAENIWVDELFRNQRSAWAEVESLERQKRFHEVLQ